jgi:hypothetical protein
MPSLSLILIVLAGVGFAGVGVEGYLLKKSYQQNAALQASNDAMSAHIKQVNDVLKEVDKTHATNLALPDDALFDGLLPKAPSP